MSRIRRREVQAIDREYHRVKGILARAEGVLLNPAFRDINDRRDAYATIKACKSTLTSLTEKRAKLVDAIKAEDEALAR